MLTSATIGMAGYGLFEAVVGIADLLGGHHLEVVADAAAVLFALLLILAAAFVRVRLPGGLALAIGALLGLQALSIHRSAHMTGAVMLTPQLARGAFAAALVALAWLSTPEHTDRPN